MKAIIHQSKLGLKGLKYDEFSTPIPKKGEVRVKLKGAGLNHRDLFVLTKHKEMEPPLVMGSDGAGVVDRIGEGVTNVNVGDEVIINPGVGWQKMSSAPPEGFEIIGYPYHGTFAEYITVPAENAISKPKFLSWEEASVLTVAGLTAYRALFTRGNIQPGMKVFIPGIGSGAATFLLQFAKTVGAEVYISSRSKEKCEKALELGADKALLNDEDWPAVLNGTKVDLVIECVGRATFNRSLELLKTGGTIVTFGASAGDVVDFDLRKFFYGQYNLLGTTLGSREEMVKMLQFMEKHQIKPVIDKIYPLYEYEQAFIRIEKAAQLGKIGFSIE